MPDVEICHPGTGGTALVPDGAVSHYRQSGWLLRSEHEANQAAAEEAAAAAEKTTKKDAKGNG